MQCLSKKFVSFIALASTLWLDVGGVDYYQSDNFLSSKTFCNKANSTMDRVVGLQKINKYAIRKQQFFEKFGVCKGWLFKLSKI